MAFYSKEEFYSANEFLANERRKQQNALRGKTARPPPGTRHPSELERQRMQEILDSIPETQPGPNAFAQQAEMQERKKGDRRVGPTREARGDALKNQLDTHPVYQAALTRSMANAPTDSHPTLRDSDCTTFTEFMQAENAESPNLKLKATPNPSSVPTFRGRVEERSEQADYERSGSLEERVPVIHPTSKMTATKDFAPRPTTPANDLQSECAVAKAPVKTPKRSIISKLKLSVNSRNANKMTGGDVPADPADQVEEEKVPVKAQAVLGETPKKHRKRMSIGSPTQIPRSPSKRNYFFQRKNVEIAEPPRPSTALGQTQRPPNTPSTIEAPQTAISDPTHFSYQQSRAQPKTQWPVAEQEEIVQKTSGVIRSKSLTLNHYDMRIPPTPPAKNTPPHEKAAKDAKEVKELREAMEIPVSERSRLVEDDVGIVSNTDLLMPTKYGNYGYRDAPTLVTQPSMMSMHASVVPDMMEATTMEEMEARVGGLDLEGFGSPTDNMIRRSNIADAVYSPSMYSPQWTAKSRFTQPGATPMFGRADSAVDDNQSAHTKDSSSNGTIPIIYPDLANDPSIVRKQDTQEAHDDNVKGSPSNRGRLLLSTDHGRTHSRDHLDNDRHSIFAHHVYNQDRRHLMYNSPSAFSHTSAMPSPLQYLPATVYTPPPKKGKGKKAVKSDADTNQITPSQIRGSNPTRGSGLGIQSDDAEAVEADNHDGLFQIKPTRRATNTTTTTTPTKLLYQKPNLPTFPNPSELASTTAMRIARFEAAANSGKLAKSPQPSSRVASATQSTQQQTVHDLATSANDDQRERAASILGVPTNQIDMVMEVLKRIEERNGQLTEMRDEMRASHARVDQRLSAIESQHRASPPLATPTSRSDEEVEAWANSQAKRISTDVAREFYQSAMGSGGQEGSEAVRSLGDEGRTGCMNGVATAQDIGALDAPSFDGGVELGARESECEGGNGGAVPGESDTIRELRETNKKLLEMVSGFAGKIEALESKMKRGSG